MFRKATRLGVCLGALTLAGGVLASFPGYASAEGGGADEFFTAVDQYRHAHPNDLGGLAAVAEEHGGTLDVSTSISGSTTPAEAERALASVDESTSSERTPLAGDFPSGVFVVSVDSARHPASTVASVGGHWNWKDEFVGQSAPFDIGSLGVSSTCGTFGSYSASTYEYDGTSTNRATLRDSGVSSGSATWNIDAVASGFTNSADHGLVSFNYDLANCGSDVQAAFIYEGNQGGSIVSVSASWGGLSIGYSNPGLTLQKSSTAVTM